MREYLTEIAAILPPVQAPSVQQHVKKKDLPALPPRPAAMEQLDQFETWGFPWKGTWMDQPETWLKDIQVARMVRDNFRREQRAEEKFERDIENVFLTAPPFEAMI